MCLKWSLLVVVFIACAMSLYSSSSSSFARGANTSGSLIIKYIQDIPLGTSERKIEKYFKSIGVHYSKSHIIPDSNILQVVIDVPSPGKYVAAYENITLICNVHKGLLSRKIIKQYIGL